MLSFPALTPPPYQKNQELWLPKGICMPFKGIGGRRARQDNRVIEIVFYEDHECILDKLPKTNLEKVT